MVRAGIVAVTLALSAFLAVPALAAEPAELPATWKRHELDFTYMGFTTRYSCEGLRDKLKLLLRHAGVRQDLRVTARGCQVGYGRIAEFPRVRIVFYAPALPTPGKPLHGEPTVGSWKSVSISRGRPRGLELGDCELVEQFRDRLLPEMTTRAVEDRTNCVPHQISGSGISLRFEALVGAPSPDAAQAAR